MLRCHIDLRSVAAARRSSCLRHLVKRGKPIAGVASILQHTVTDEASAACAAEAVGEPGLGVCVPVEVDAWTHGEAAVTAAVRHALGLEEVLNLVDGRERLGLPLPDPSCGRAAHGLLRGGAGGFARNDQSPEPASG